jgi:hypothetical protein
MTSEEIIRMAREQGLPETEVEGVFRVNTDDLGRFAAAERERLRWDGIHTCGPTCDNPSCVAVREAVEAEREACAKVCEEVMGAWTETNYNDACGDCAHAILARGEQ